ncbi:hypothetical protein OUZ56_027948 [Daphnia magna]|uniref:Uncharacterized protein n=1 Tax=Daphnia magna TaxID=35525 RepID=A0ABR0B2E3_9CRUS|nr:hypothetical protein OUZ56_027948 [Daphnia magna]
MEAEYHRLQWRTLRVACHDLNMQMQKRNISNLPSFMSVSTAHIDKKFQDMECTICLLPRQLRLSVIQPQH